MYGFFHGDKLSLEFLEEYVSEWLCVYHQKQYS